MAHRPDQARLEGSDPVTGCSRLPVAGLAPGFEATLHYGADGNRSLMGLGDRPVVTPYEIRDGRRIETTLLGDRMSVALFSVDGRTLGARDDEAGYVNYEAFAMG
jgi:hypothetical protein